ncbi:Uncharacterised protein [Serratia marcescens]|nr:Uncharacterised protein [Serratia marcescens]
MQKTVTAALVAALPSLTGAAQAGTGIDLQAYAPLFTRRRTRKRTPWSTTGARAPNALRRKSTRPARAIRSAR